MNLNDIDRIIILPYHFIINFSSVFTQVPKTMNFEEPLIKQIQETCEPSSGNSSVLAYALTRSGSRMPRSVASSPGKCIRIRFGNGSCSMKSIKLPEYSEQITGNGLKKIPNCGRIILSRFPYRDRF